MWIIVSQAITVWVVNYSSNNILVSIFLFQHINFCGASGLCLGKVLIFNFWTGLITWLYSETEIINLPIQQQRFGWVNLR